MALDIRISHGNVQKIHSKRCVVSDQCTSESLLDRTLQEMVGLHSAKFLATNEEQTGGVIDAGHLAHLDTTVAKGRILRVPDGIFHAKEDSTNFTDCSPDATAWCYLGCECDGK